MSDLRAELASLRAENARLRKLLKLTDAEAAPARGTQAAWFDNAPGPVDARSSPRAKVEFYAALFGARRDVYAVRWENARTGKSGWVPAVEGGWRKGRAASDTRYLPLTPEVLAAHLIGDIHIGLYPMLQRDQTCWLAAMLDALACLKAAEPSARPPPWRCPAPESGRTYGSSSPTPSQRPRLAKSGRRSCEKPSRSAAGWTCALTTASSPPKTCSPAKVWGTRSPHHCTASPASSAPPSSSTSPPWSRTRTSGTTSPPWNETLDDHLVLPRGLLDTATRLCARRSTSTGDDADGRRTRG